MRRIRLTEATRSSDGLPIPGYLELDQKFGVPRSSADTCMRSHPRAKQPHQCVQRHTQITESSSGHCIAYSSVHLPAHLAFLASITHDAAALLVTAITQLKHSSLLSEARQYFIGSTLGSVECARQVSGVRDARFAASKRHALRPCTGDPGPLARARDDLPQTGPRRLR